MKTEKDILEKLEEYKQYLSYRNQDKSTSITIDITIHYSRMIDMLNWIIEENKKNVSTICVVRYKI